MDIKKKTFRYREACKIGRAVFQWILPYWQAQFGEEQILYIDESGINSKATAEYGWSEKGKRCEGIQSGGHGQRFNIISAVRSNQPYCFIAPCVFAGHCDRQLFTQWLEYLLQQLPKDKKHLLILDNASIHKSQEIKQLVKQYHCEIRYLPAYSPDYNPIEKAWSVLKSKIRHYVAQFNLSINDAIDLSFKEM